MQNLKWVREFLQDAVHGLRVLRKNPVMMGISVVTLALGIGATASIFTVVNAVLLKPLPYKDPGRLVWLTESIPEEPDHNVSWLDLQDWKRRTRNFESLAGYADNTFTLTGREKPRVLNGQYVTADYFSVMGVPPLLGQTFGNEDHVPGGPAVVVLSYRLWQQDFGNNPRIIGTNIKLSAKNVTVIGVMPNAFGDAIHADVWVPLEGYAAKVYLTNRSLSWFLYSVGRLRPGVSLEQASAEMEGIAQALAREYPESNRTTGVRLQQLSTRIAGQLRPVLLTMTAAVVFLLCIACSNIAGLLLVKAAAREKEVSVRLALGAKRGRIFRQFMAESFVLSSIGGVLGLLLTWLATGLMVRALPKDLPVLDSIKVDGTVLAMTSLVILGVGVGLGLAPAFMAFRLNLQSALKARVRQLSRGQRRMHAALVISEITLAMALLVGAALMTRSMLSLLRVDPGFNPEHLLTATALLPDSQMPPEQISMFFKETTDDLEHIPGVRSAAAVYPPPFNPQLFRAYMGVEGLPPVPGQERTTYFVMATPQSFQTLEVPLLRGRQFANTDIGTAAPVVAVDEAFAQKYFPRQDALGKRIKLFTQDFNDQNPKKKPLTIVAVVGNVKSGGLDSDLGGQIYLPSDQLPNLAMAFVVRSNVTSASIARQVESVVHRHNPEVPVYSVQTMQETVNASLFTRRVAMILLGVFAISALLLSILGLYGVMSYLVTQRTGEIGLRMALGAPPVHVIGLFVRHGAKIVLMGIGGGLLASFFLARLMPTLLFGVSMQDPLTCAAAGALLGTIAMMACYFPARRAVRVDPTIALRHE